MGGGVRETVLEMHYDAHMSVSQIASAALVGEDFARATIIDDWHRRSVAHDVLVTSLRNSRIAREDVLDPIIEQHGGPMGVDELADALGIDRGDVIDLCRRGLLDASKKRSKWSINGANAGGGDD